MRAKPPRATVVIPNWNGLDHLPECLEKLSAQTFTDFEVLVVDNASTDNSVPWLREHHPEVRVIQRATNGGFSKAVNEGIRAAKTEYTALLNNDTAVDVRWLEALVAALDAHPSYDIAASKMILYHDPGLLNAAGSTYSLMRLRNEDRGLGEPVSRYDKMCRVLGACAGAALYRRSLFSEVGLFDEDFFLMSEDTDFSLRCLIAGKRCIYAPAAVVRHKLRASIDTEPAWEMTRLAARNEALVAAKNLPGLLLPMVPAVRWCRALRHTLPLRPSHWRRVPGLIALLPELLRAEMEGFRLGLAKRPEAWRRKAVGTAEILRWLIRGTGPA